VDDHSGTNLVLPPGDDHNRRLREHVHPAAWPVHPSAGVYDLVAIGGGTAGLVASGGATLLGARAALVERAYLGGDCLVTGCVPSKALIAAAAVAHAVRRAAEFGVRAGPVQVDFPAVMDRVRRVRAEMPGTTERRRCGTGAWTCCSAPRGSPARKRSTSMVRRSGSGAP
jgi:hypothetical protein